MKTILYSIFIFLLATSVEAQYYDFVSFNRTYFESDNWTSLNNGEVWDDPSYEIPIPFDFSYFGETINTIYLMEDGLGTLLGTKSSFDDGPLSLLLPYDLDVVDRGYNEGVSLSEIRYRTEVTDDNELFIIEWHNVGFYSEIANGINESFISFQVIFNRNFNAIELSFGESNIVNPDLAYDGETGGSVCLLHNINDDGDVVTADEALCLIGEANNPSTMLFDPNEDDQIYLLGDIPINKSYLFSVSDAVSTSNIINAEEIDVFPSPATEILHIDSKHIFSKYRITTIMGKVVQIDNLNSQSIEIANLVSGMYMIELETKDGDIVSKSIIKK